MGQILLISCIMASVEIVVVLVFLFPPPQNPSAPIWHYLRTRTSNPPLNAIPMQNLEGKEKTSAVYKSQIYMEDTRHQRHYFTSMGVLLGYSGFSRD